MRQAVPSMLAHAETPTGEASGAIDPKPLRIFLLSPHPHVRGPLPKHTPLLIDGLRQAGCDVSTASWGRHGDADSLVARLWTRVRDVHQLRRQVRASEFDVLVIKTSHEWVSMARDLPLLLATRRSSPCTVVQFHGGESERLAEAGSRLFKAVSRAIFMLCNGVLFLSTDEARAAHRFHRHGRFHVVVNPFLPTPARAAAESVTGDQVRPATILFVGRLIEEKGVLDLLEATARLRARLPARLVIAGSGPISGRVETRARELGISEHATLKGELDRERLADLYVSADLLALPTYWGEGFPTVISEAMNAGLPIVTTRLRGMADHLVENENALFVAPKAPAELSDAIERLLRDPELRARMAAANREKVKLFAPHSAARLYLSALTEVCQHRQTATQ